MNKLKVSNVFVPGGMPKHTYVERAQTEIKNRLNEAKENLCKLVTLTGQTKSGKTVLTQTVFPELEEKNIWINGGSIENENDIWEQIVDKLEGYTSYEESDSDNTNSQLSGKFAAEANALVVKGKGEIGATTGIASTKTNKTSRTLSSKSTALKLLQESGASLIVDDFHYIPKDLQGNFVRAVKPLVFHGIPVILIAIPHRRYDAIKVEKEITGRLENINIPYWKKDELLQIANIGFPLLNIDIDNSVIDRFAEEAMGSPHLMQEFCKQVCKKHNVDETTNNKKHIYQIDDDLFKAIGDSTGKTIFDKLATGPRQRTDRIKRKLKDGTEVDIYKTVLLALAKMRPTMQTIQYEELRLSIKEILHDSIPQAHEVSRVLDKMSEIASNENASTPVIDWEKEEQKLHITDPFFAFYLKWSAPQI